MKETLHHPCKTVDFIDFFLKFEDIIGAKMRPSQIKFCELLEKYKRVCALWCRQTGKSTTVAAVALAHALMNKNYNILIVAPSQRQSGETFDRMRKFMLNNPLIMDYCTKFTATEIIFKNGSRIMCVPVGPEGITIRGFTANMIIIEESGYIKDKIVTEVLLPMVATTEGIIIKIGTPKGKQHFYESCFGKQTNYQLIFYDYKMALKEGAFTEKYINEMRDACTDLEFRTEWEAKFIEDVDCYFPQKLIDFCIEDVKQLDLTVDSRHTKAEYILGVDFARLGQDTTVFIVLERPFNKDFYQVSYYHEMKHKLLNEAGGMVVWLHNWFNFERIYLDETGLGAGVSDYLSEQLGGWKVEPITFTIKSKEDIYSNLKLLMGKGLIKIPNYRKLVFQLSDLRYELTGTGRFKIHHPTGGYDDFSDALALAAWHFRPVGGAPTFMIR